MELDRIDLKILHAYRTFAGTVLWQLPLPLG